MLATYFKEYPQSLAVIAKRQAKANNLHLPITMEVIPEKAYSDTGKTYTLSDKSEDFIQESTEIIVEKETLLEVQCPQNGTHVLNGDDTIIEENIRNNQEALNNCNSIEKDVCEEIISVDSSGDHSSNGHFEGKINQNIVDKSKINLLVDEKSNIDIQINDTSKNGLAYDQPKEEVQLLENLKSSTLFEQKFKKNSLMFPKPAKEDSSDDDCLSTTTYLSSPPPVSSDPSLKLAYTPTYTATVNPKMDPCCPIHGDRIEETLTASKSSSSVSSKASVESQLLHCGICSKRFNNPKVLPCLHTFCEQCLVGYCPPESLTLTCPVCRQQSILPKDGVVGLQVNEWMGNMMNALAGTRDRFTPCKVCCRKAKRSCTQCNISLCLSCATNHTQVSETNSHTIVVLEKTKYVQTHSEYLEDTTLYCPSHSGQTLRFYCMACETAVCSSCTDIEHRSHETVRLGEAQEEQKAVLQKLIDRVSAQLPYIKDVVSDLSNLTSELGEKRVYAEGQVKTYFKALHSLLESKEKQLVRNISSVAEKKQLSIDAQTDDLEDWIDGIESGCHFLQNAINGCPAMGLVLVRKQLGEKLMDYADRSIPQAPLENAHLQFVTGHTETVKIAIDNVGSIRTSSAVPHQTTALVEGLNNVVVGRCVRVTALTRDQYGRRLTKGESDIDATVTTNVIHASNGICHSNGQTKDRHLVNGNNLHLKSVRVRIEDNIDGSYDIVFTPHQAGPHTLSVKLFNHDINASPFKFVVYEHDDEILSQHSARCPISRQLSRSTQLTRTSKTSRTSGHPASHKSSCSRRTNPLEDDLIMRIGKRGRSKGEFVNPQGICYSPVREGRIAVADSNNQCVQVFTASGESKIKFGIRGRKPGQLQRPTGVAVLPNNNYVVADYENKWVSIFEPSGKYVSRIGHGKLLGPKGVCVDNRGNILVVDNKSSTVCLFSPVGKLIVKFGNRGMDEHSFAGPHFVAVNSKCEIIVTDFHNHCVRVFDSRGEFLFTFGSSGEGNGQFNAPTGIAVDSKDNIIVADWGNARIQIFDCEGSFLTYVNTQLDPLYGPQGLTLTEDGHIVVADSGNHCFKMYKYLQ